MPTVSPSRRNAIAVGDYVRLPANASNELFFYGAQPGSGRQGARPVQGVVSSIRQIATGELLGLAVGDLRQYVFELVPDQCFDRSFSSDTNCEGSKGPDRITDNSIWHHLRSELHRRAERREFLHHAPPGSPAAKTGDGIADSLESILDGWRIVKVRAANFENLGESAS